MMEVENIRFDEQGLVPAIIRDRSTGKVLTLAYMNRESLQRTLETGQTWFWSRSRQELWHKGATSGNTQTVQAIFSDCDTDALLVEVEQKGNACHTGAYSCFFNRITGPQTEPATGKKDIGAILQTLMDVIRQRKESLPEESYTTYLFSSGLDKILKKVGEEAAETIIAAKNHAKQEIASEAADLLYHLLVLFAEENVSLDEVAAVLADREGKKPKKLRGGHETGG